MMSCFTEKEILAIQELRKRLEGTVPITGDKFGWRDDSLIRWIRARDMDIDKAEDMFKKVSVGRRSMQWRIDNRVDNILDGGVELELQEKFPFYVDGVDKWGRPVVTMDMGAWDIRAQIETEDGAQQFYLYTNQMLERLFGAIKHRTFENAKNEQLANNSSGVQFIVIPNLAGYSYRQLANIKAVQSIFQLVSNYEAHYPETLAHCIVINAPPVFALLFKLAKPFLSGGTLGKIEVFSGNKEEWLPRVLELIEPNQIRENYGGTKP